MKTSIIYYAKVAAFIFVITGVISCKKDTSDPDPYVATPYQLTVPDGFPQPVLPAFNPLTVEGIRLGRKLYYDPILSTNGLTCSSCHIKEKSYSSPLFITAAGDPVSVPPHVNIAWNPDYNWNGSQPVLDRLCLGDFEPEFFNTNMPLLVTKLMEHADYPRLFKEAFNNDNIASLSYDELKLEIVYSISQFMRTMVSSNSRFDKFMRHEIMFTPEEIDGFVTFTTERGDCFHCHGHPLMTSNNFHNNGLDVVHTGADQGRFLVTGKSTDIGRFSSATLRNIELTAPYMHDGRYQTLEEVVEFYNSGVNLNSPNIDPIMAKPAKLNGLELTPIQKANLVIFLKSMTDSTFINNPDYQKP